jgi:hypothetical protein
MPDDKIPADVKRLIHNHINSVEQLEVFLLLREQSDREWNAVEVSRELRIQPESAATRLAALTEGRLLASTGGADKTALCYRYQPATSDLERAASGLSAAYKERRYSVIDLIFSKPTDNIRTFSDAFRIRRED